VKREREVKKKLEKAETRTMERKGKTGNYLILEKREEKKKKKNGWRGHSL